MSTPNPPFKYTREQWEEAVFNLATSPTYPPNALEGALSVLLDELSTATNLSYEQQALLTGIAGVLLKEAGNKLRNAGKTAAAILADVPSVH